MNRETLKNIFRKSSKDQPEGALPRRVTTSAYTDRAAHDYLKTLGIVAVPGKQAVIKAVQNKNGNYDVTAYYTSMVEEFEAFSKAYRVPRKVNQPLGRDLNPREALGMMMAYEQAGLGRRIRLNRGEAPGKARDGSVHIRAIAKNRKLMKQIRPDLYAASRLKKLTRKPGPGAH